MASRRGSSQAPSRSALAAPPCPTSVRAWSRSQQSRPGIHRRVLSPRRKKNRERSPRNGSSRLVPAEPAWCAWCTDDGDAQFEGHTYGWVAFFRILRLYLTHFPGQRCSAFQLSGFSKAPVLETWRSVLSSLSSSRSPSLESSTDRCGRTS